MSNKTKNCKKKCCCCCCKPKPPPPKPNLCDELVSTYKIEDGLTFNPKSDNNIYYISLIYDILSLYV